MSVVIIVSKKVHNYLTRQQELTGNEHGETIKRMIKDSKEFRGINPDAPYPEPLKWSKGSTKSVKVSEEVNSLLIDLRIAGMTRARTSEYSNARIFNDLLSDAEELNKTQQEAYKEMDADIVKQIEDGKTGKIKDFEEVAKGLGI